MHIVSVTGYQQLTAANLAAAFALTPVKDPQTGARPNAAYLSASATAVRYTDDGLTTPTAAIGMRIPTGIAPFLYQGNMEKFRAILESGSPTLDIVYLIVAD